MDYKDFLNSSLSLYKQKSMLCHFEETSKGLNICSYLLHLLAWGKEAYVRYWKQTAVDPQEEKNIFFAVNHFYCKPWSGTYPVGSWMNQIYWW